MLTISRRPMTEAERAELGLQVERLTPLSQPDYGKHFRENLLGIGGGCGLFVAVVVFFTALFDGQTPGIAMIGAFLAWVLVFCYVLFRFASARERKWCEKLAEMHRSEAEHLWTQLARNEVDVLEFEADRIWSRHKGDDGCFLFRVEPAKVVLLDLGEFLQIADIGREGLVASRVRLDYFEEGWGVFGAAAAEPYVPAHNWPAHGDALLGELKDGDFPCRMLTLDEIPDEDLRQELLAVG